MSVSLHAKIATADKQDKPLAPHPALSPDKLTPPEVQLPQSLSPLPIRVSIGACLHIGRQDAEMYISTLQLIGAN